MLYRDFVLFGVKGLNMATISIVLRKNYSKNDGTCPLALRITKNRKSRFIYTGEYVLPKHWDENKKIVKKIHPNSARLNNMLVKKISEAHEIALEAESKEQNSSAKSISKKITGEDQLDFFSVSKIYLSNLLKRKKYNQHYNQERRIRIFRKFVGSDKLSFQDLNVSLLNRFDSFLIHERGVSPRTSVNYLMLIRTIYNFARREFDIDYKYYPFGKGKIQIKFPESEKIGLNREEIILLETINDITPSQQIAVDTWLFSFYFAGIRVGDVLKLKKSDFRDGRLYYRMGKNNKLVSLAIPLKADKILNKYCDRTGNEDHLIFPFLNIKELENTKKLSIRIKTVTRNLNRRLEIVAKKLGIQKKVSMHIARHSFGNISGDTIPIQMLQKLYRHSSITTTVNYQANFMHKETDDALEKVINF